MRRAIIPEQYTLENGIGQRVCEIDPDLAAGSPCDPADDLGEGRDGDADVGPHRWRSVYPDPAAQVRKIQDAARTMP